MLKKTAGCTYAICPKLILSVSTRKRSSSSNLVDGICVKMPESRLLTVFASKTEADKSKYRIGYNPLR